MHPPIEQGVALEFSKAKFNDEPELKFWTSTMFLYGKWRVNRQVALLYEIPVANVDYDFKGDFFRDPYAVRSSAIGNPYFGFELAGDRTHLVAEIGVRPPLMGNPQSDGDELPPIVGAYMAYDRFEGFVPKLTSLNAAFGYRGRYPSGNISSTFRFLAGPIMMVPDEGDAELFIDGYADYWMQSQRFAIGFGLTGRYLLTESEVDFGDRTVFQIKSAAQVGFGQFHPGIHFQIPLDSELSDLVSFTFGIDLIVDLSRPQSDAPADADFH